MLSGAHAQTSYCETWNELNPAVSNRILTMEVLPSNANTAPERTAIVKIIFVGVYLSVVPGFLLGTLLTFMCNLTIGLVFGIILSISNSLLVWQRKSKMLFCANGIFNGVFYMVEWCKSGKQVFNV